MASVRRRRIISRRRRCRGEAAERERNGRGVGLRASHRYCRRCPRPLVLGRGPFGRQSGEPPPTATWQLRDRTGRSTGQGYGSGPSGRATLGQRRVARPPSACIPPPTLRAVARTQAGRAHAPNSGHRRRLTAGLTVCGRAGARTRARGGPDERDRQQGSGETSACTSCRAVMLRLLLAPTDAAVTAAPGATVTEAKRERRSPAPRRHRRAGGADGGAAGLAGGAREAARSGGPAALRDLVAQVGQAAGGHRKQAGAAACGASSGVAWTATVMDAVS